MMAALVVFNVALIMYVPEFERPEERAVVEEFLEKIAVGFDRSKASGALAGLNDFWPGADGSGLSVEAFDYLARVVDAAHDDPEIMARFLETRGEVSDVTEFETAV